MRELSELSELELKEAHDAAAQLLSEKFRQYLQGPMLPTLLAKFRDDVLDVLGMELPPRLPMRVGHQKLDALTDAELGTLEQRVATLLGNSDFMDDPALVGFLADLRQDLVAERGRARAARHGSLAGRVDMLPSY